MQLIFDIKLFVLEDILDRERLFNYSAEGATTPETLRQKDRKKKFWKEIRSHRRSKSLRYQYRWGKIGTYEYYREKWT